MYMYLDFVLDLSFLLQGHAVSGGEQSSVLRGQCPLGQLSADKIEDACPSNLEPSLLSPEL